MGELAAHHPSRAADAVVPAVAELAFRTFFEDERGRLLQTLVVITGSRHESEDIAQEAFTRVYERWERVGAMSDPAGYLHRTAMNVYRSQYRRTKVALQRAVLLGPEPDFFDGIEDRDAVVEALAALSPRQRAALVLTEGLGYSGEEAGQMLGIRASTVWALTHQARTKLHRIAEVDDD